MRRDDNGTFVDWPLEDREKTSEIAAASRNNSAAARVTREMERNQNIAAHNRLVERSIAMEENDLKKPSVGDKIIAQRTRAYQAGDILGVQNADRRIEKRQATRRNARHRSKARKRALREYCRELEFKNRTPDPSSGDERTPLA